MAVAQIGVLDLSVVTDALVRLIDPHVGPPSPLWNGPPPFPLAVSGSMPESVRGDGGCQLSFYLFHVAQDPYQLNSPMQNPWNDPPVTLPESAYEIPFLPQPLDLFYLLTAFSESNYVEEQQAMSVAMQRLYENPIFVTSVQFGQQQVREKFTVTMAVETADEIGRLWQAISAPLRLSAVYKVSVVFITSEEVEAAAPDVERFTVTAPPALAQDTRGEVTETSIAATYAQPDQTVGRFDLAPAVVAPGDRFLLHGAGLDAPTAKRLYLLQPGQPRVEVTAWRQDLPRSPTTAHLRLPNVGAPSPGLYQLQVGSETALGDQANYSSNATPFSIAARIDVGVSPPLLQSVAGVFSLAGAGFVGGGTEVWIAGNLLGEVGGAPGQGQFSIGGGGTAVDFKAPANVAPGRYPVVVRVNGVESRPSWWVDL